MMERDVMIKHLAASLAEISRVQHRLARERVLIQEIKTQLAIGVLTVQQAEASLAKYECQLAVD